MSAAASSNGGKEEAELTQAVDKFFDLLQVCESEGGERSTREGRREGGRAFDGLYMRGGS